MVREEHCSLPRCEYCFACFDRTKVFAMPSNYVVFSFNTLNLISQYECNHINKQSDSFNENANDKAASKNNKDDPSSQMCRMIQTAATVSSQQQNSNNDNINNNPTSIEDDIALAAAIATQDLPPGVSAHEQQEIMMRLLTQQLRRRGDWDVDGDGHVEGLSPALEARLRDFEFAQKKRRETYGSERPWGILGLYDHLGECDESQERW